MGNMIYMRMRNRVQVHPQQMICLNDIAQIIAEEDLLRELKDLPIHHVSVIDKNIIVIDAMQVIRIISKKFPNAELQIIGPSQSIIEVVYKKKQVSIPFFLLIWMLLFFGSALAIMYFHEDVSMRETQQRVYKIVTGIDEEKPLLLQIPYSFGLGIGMVLFFNHFFRKRLNEEPSPLEIEMFNYQQDIDQYVTVTENKESVKFIDDY